MRRPSRSLISRESAAAAALDVIDVHGLDALSLELVARRIGVRAPSLYHHFRDKAELLEEVARLILLDVNVPDPAARHWKQALLDLAVETRRSILKHPNAAPLLLHFFPRQVLLAAYDHWIAICPLPVHQHLVLIEGLDKLTLGWALFEASCRSRTIEPMPRFDAAKLPHLAAAIRASDPDDEPLFVATIKAFLDGLAPVAAPAASRRSPDSNAPIPTQR